MVRIRRPMGMEPKILSCSDKAVFAILSLKCKKQAPGGARLPIQPISAGTSGLGRGAIKFKISIATPVGKVKICPRLAGKRKYFPGIAASAEYDLMAEKTLLKLAEMWYTKQTTQIERARDIPLKITLDRPFGQKTAKKAAGNRQKNLKKQAGVKKNRRSAWGNDMCGCSIQTKHTSNKLIEERRLCLTAMAAIRLWFPTLVRL